MSDPVKLFCCYAREDKTMLEMLIKHLAPLKHQGQITIWSDNNINAGAAWEKELSTHLESADIILLLISPDFIASPYCYSKEMVRALERHNAGSAQVIAILLSPVLWQNALFAHLQVVPTDARPIISWRNMDEAFHDVAKHIYQVIFEFQHTTTIPPGNLPVQEMNFEQAISIVQQREEVYLQAHTSGETGTLIVSTQKGNRGKTVYLLSHETFLKCKTTSARDNHSMKQKGTITLHRVGTYPLFIARFRNLQARRYDIWTGWGVDNPKSTTVQIDAGCVAELELDWEI